SAVYAPASSRASAGANTMTPRSLWAACECGSPTIGRARRGSAAETCPFLLAGMLRLWRCGGWAAAFGRPAVADHVIVPFVRKKPGRRGRHGGPLEMAMLSRSVTGKDL